MATRIVWATIVFAALAAAAPAFAAPIDRARQEVQIADCIHEAARGHIWLERTLWALRDKEGGWIGAEIPNSDGSFDLGPLQINSWWIKRIAAVTRRPATQVRFWLARDACFNVEAARWIFLSGFADSSGYWRAVGVYHSPTPWRQRAYAVGVAARIQRRFGPAAFSSVGANR